MNALKLVASLALAVAACGAPDPITLVEPPAPPPAPTTPVVPTAPVVTLAAFTISPHADTLLPGDTLRFSAKAIFSDSKTRPLKVKWTASGGTMDSTGLLTAGTALGKIMVVAVCACTPADSAAAAAASAAMDSARVEVLAPAPVVEAVALRLHRMDGGSGDVLVSNGMPLPPGWLPNPAAKPPVRITLNGVEVPSYVEVLKGKHKDGSVMSVLVQFVWPASATGDAVFELGASSRLPARSKVDLSGEMSAAAALPIDPEYLVSTLVVGPTASRFQTLQSSGFLATYEAEFDKWSEAHWASYGAGWAAMNYYDRVLSHFAFWVRTGNPVLWERASRIALDYRDKYLEANGYGTSEYWAQLDGLAVHYWLTADARSRDAVFKSAESLHRSRGTESRLSNNTSHPWMDNRVQAKVLGSKLLAMRLEAPPYGAITDWAVQARLDLGWILSTQNPTGPYNFQSVCSYSNNFMTGMLNSVFIQYHEHFEPDPRILPSVKQFQDWLWDTQWRPNDQVYNYFSGLCPGEGGPTPANDLNGFYLETYGWLYARTGDPKYLERGDATYAGLVAKTWFQNTKMYNQAFQFSWRYLGYRR